MARRRAILSAWEPICCIFFLLQIELFFGRAVPPLDGLNFVVSDHVGHVLACPGGPLLLLACPVVSDHVGRVLACPGGFFFIIYCRSPALLRLSGAEEAQG